MGFVVEVTIGGPGPARPVRVHQLQQHHHFLVVAEVVQGHRQPLLRARGVVGFVVVVVFVVVFGGWMVEKAMKLRVVEGVTGRGDRAFEIE